MAHGKESRKRARVKRAGQKAAMKAARQALWDSVKGTAKNKKKKVGGRAEGISNVYARIDMPVRVKINGEWTVATRRVHGGPDCRNVGCKRCSTNWKVA